MKLLNKTWVLSLSLLVALPPAQTPASPAGFFLVRIAVQSTLPPLTKLASRRTAKLARRDQGAQSLHSPGKGVDPNLWGSGALPHATRAHYQFH